MLSRSDTHRRTVRNSDVNYNRRVQPRVQDDIGASGTITFVSNEVVKSLSIALVDNNLQEPHSVQLCMLSNPRGATLERPKHARKS